jgi:DNA-directed RNA polymerase subunit N (RpoN/RPB10)
MLYFKCPTCKTILANKQIPFEEGLEKICENSSLTQEERDQKKMELLDQLEVKRMCCRMRMMSYVKLIEIIK